MTNLPTPRHAAQVTKTFAEGSIVVVVVLASVIVAATLIYAWFFT
jgi:hypothetical protein